MSGVDHSNVELFTLHEDWGYMPTTESEDFLDTMRLIYPIHSGKGTLEDPTLRTLATNSPPLRLDFSST